MAVDRLVKTEGAFAAIAREVNALLSTKNPAIHWGPFIPGPRRRDEVNKGKEIE